MQPTIALLPASLYLVHIPRNRLSRLSHPILKQILQPSPIFFNITCNDLELTIFAQESILDDFEPICRKDRRRLRSRSNSSSSRKCSKSREHDPVEISYEKWSVLQVDSHNDQLDNAGARVNEVSAPLAAAGISILYQSSYTSDFIFVKQSRLEEAMNLLATAGYDVYAADAMESPVGSTRPFQAFGTCSERDVRNIHPTPTVESSQEDTSTHLSRPNQDTSRNKSHSPSEVEVRLLPSDLACVGLSDDPGVDHWALKIIKLVAFPELISSPTFPRLAPSSAATSAYSEKPSPLLFDLTPIPYRANSSDSSSPSVLSEDEDDGYFSHSPPAQSYSPVLTSASRCRSDIFQGHSSIHSQLRRPPACSLGGKKCESAATDSGSRVPFLSYTRTSEGSSLTADVYVLSTLFPSSERHMVNSSGELDEADHRLRNGVGAEQLGHSPDLDDDTVSHMNMLSCLQIDLQCFGLDKHGLVNRFSQTLRENGINHMYSSTFKTANILVDKRYARRAQALLCGLRT